MPPGSSPSPADPLPPAAGSRRLWPGDPIAALALRPDGYEAIAPPDVARDAGLRAVSLQGRAQARASAHGWTPASALTAWRALGTAVDEVVGAGDTSAWRRALARPVAELLAAGVGVPTGRPNDRSSLSPSAAPPDVSNGTRVAWRVALRHAERLAEHRLVDVATLLPLAASLPPASGASGTDASGAEAPAAGEDRRAEEPWFVSLPAAPTAAEVRWIAAAAPTGSIVAIAPEATDAIARLTAHGFIVDPDAPAPGTVPQPVAFGFATEDEQVRWMLTHDRDAATTDDAQPALLVVADPVAAAPRIEAAAWELGVPVRVEHPVALRRTALGGFLLLLADAIERGLPYETTLQALRHRFAGGMSDDVFAEARVRRPVGLDAWQTIDDRSALLAWPRRALRATYVRHLQRLLQRLDLPGDMLAAHERAALQLVLRGIAERPLPAPEAGEAAVATTEPEEVGVGSFLADLRDLLALLTIRAPAVRGDPPAAARPVRVASPAQAAAMRVRSVRVLGMNEGVLPADVVEPSILDAFDRDRLREVGVDLPDAGERARIAWADLQAALRAAGEEVLLGVPERSGGDALLPSPYLERLGLVPRPAPARLPASPEERRRAVLPRLAAAGPAGPAGPTGDAGLRQAMRAWHVERGREGGAPPDRFDGITGREIALDGPDGWRFSATSLQTLGQCAFRFFVRYRLGVEPFEESDERITPQLRGRLWHQALERAVRNVVADDPASAAGAHADARDEDLRDRIAHALPAAYADSERAVGVPDPEGEAWRRVRAGEIRALVRFVRSDAFLTPGFRPHAVERHFAGDWRGLSVRGIVDRVDVAEAGVELIDYKSGTSAPKGALGDDRRTWIDVQLPLYLEAGAPALPSDADRPAGVAHPALRARYLSIRSAETLLSVEPSEHDAALAELVGRVRRSAAGSWPVDPDPRREVCRSCELAVVCRVGPRIERKRDAAVLRSEDAAP